MAAICALLATVACGGDRERRGDVGDASEHDAEVEGSWPAYDESECAEAGLRWYRDMVQPYCPGAPCQARVAACFCTLPCESDADCAGTTTPFCGRVVAYSFSDNAGCSWYRVCIPQPDDGSYWGCARPPMAACGDDEGETRDRGQP